MITENDKVFICSGDLARLFVLSIGIVKNSLHKVRLFRPQIAKTFANCSLTGTHF